MQNNYFCNPQLIMVPIAQLVRASDCGSEGRRFEPGWVPKMRVVIYSHFFYFQSFTFYACIIPTLNFFLIGEWLAISIPMEIHLRVSIGLITASTHRREAA